MSISWKYATIDACKWSRGTTINTYDLDIEAIGLVKKIEDASGVQYMWIREVFLSPNLWVIV